jgi:Fur family ferric uptake transcriptional regulator
MTDQAKELGNALQQRGYRLTAARQVILEVLVASGGHMSADDLAEKVRQQAPGVGRMTVYRTLDLLNELGFIRPVYQGTGAAHYILLEEGHHH